MCDTDAIQHAPSLAPRCAGFGTFYRPTLVTAQAQQTFLSTSSILFVHRSCCALSPSRRTHLDGPGLDLVRAAGEEVLQVQRLVARHDDLLQLAVKADTGEPSRETL